MEKGGKAQRKSPPPPPPLPHLVPASCLRCACDMRATKGRRQGRPPPPPTHLRPPQGWGMKVGGGEKRTPPEDKAAGWGGSGERVRDGPHDRARREHAPYKPQRGDHRGCERRVGRATTGATRQAPPPPAEGQVPRLVPAPCSRRAYARGQTTRTPPPTPHPLTPHHRADQGKRDATAARNSREMSRNEKAGRRSAPETQARHVVTF